MGFNPAAPFGVAGGLIIYLIGVVLLWKIFEKAGKPGWYAIIPIYNAYVLVKIIGWSGWGLLLLFIPIVNLVATLFLAVHLAKSFGKGGLFGIVGLWIFSIIGLAILAFGSAEYSPRNESAAEFARS
ncbi:hypothetical protein D5S17_05930 [Pseudonocardiaceae bacterium YIM PH 21723]|nr:hypothetical protein D5S17_05930 [Pseudonocardiaceae bacterium YIM PH 21723]